MEPGSAQMEQNRCTESDNQLLDQIAAGQEEAFNGLVERYRVKVYSYAFYFLQTPCDAEDVTQETFIRAFLNVGKFRRESSFLTWLFRIASNVSNQQIRKLVRQRRMKENLLKNNMEETFETMVTPEEVTLKNEIQEVVFEAMQKLRPKHKEVLVLKEINGLDVIEVASICKVPVGTIKSRLNRARLDLRKHISRLKGLGGELEQ